MILLSVGLDRHRQGEIVARVFHDGRHYDVTARRDLGDWRVADVPDGMTSDLASEAVRLAVERYRL